MKQHLLETKHTQIHKHKYINMCAYNIHYICVCVCILSRFIVSSSLRPYRLQPSRLLCPRDSPGRNSGAGCYVLLQGVSPTQGPSPYDFMSPALAGELCCLYSYIIMSSKFQQKKKMSWEQMITESSLRKGKILKFWNSLFLIFFTISLKMLI